MQVNSASSFTPQSNGSLSVDNQNQVAEQRERFRVQQAQQSTEQTEQRQKQSTQQAQDQAQQVERFDIDEQALALVEQAQFENQQAQLNESSLPTASPENSSASRQVGNQNSNQTANQSGEQARSQADFDSPSKRNQTAVAAYSSVDNIAKRENIQQVFGIDLLA